MRHMRGRWKMNEREARFWILQGDVFVGGVLQGGRYIGSRVCKDPGFMVRSDEAIFFAPLISPADGM